MSFPARKWAGYVGGLLCLSGVLVLTAQEAAQPKSDPAQQSTPPAASGTSDAASAAQTAQPSASTGQQTQAQQGGQPTAPAQAASTSTGQTVPGTVLKVTTRMVLVDVVVTDGSGRPVLDLKPDNFDVKENGKKQTIRGFALQKEAPVSATPIKPRVLPAGVYTNIPDFHPEVGPPTVLLIDGLNTPLKDQLYMRQQLLKYLQKLEPRRNVAIYTLGTRLRLLQDFTNDPELLQTALKKFSYHSSSLNQETTDDSDTAGGDSGDPALADMEQSLHDFAAEEESFRKDVQVQITLDALKRLGHYLAGYPGRKNLVWVSGSIPFNVSPDTSLSSPFSVQRQYGDQIRDAAGVLTDSQVAVYPVDARGLVGSFMPDASQSGAAFARSRGGVQAMTASMNKQSAALQTAHDSMNEIADQTGGRAYYNRNDIDHAIALSVAEGSTYYTLGYYPEDKGWDGKFRKIEVKVNRPGLKLHHRRGYFAVDPERMKPKDEKAARRELFAALNPESPMSTSLPFLVRITPPSKDQHSVLVDFSVEPKAISFDPQGELQHAEIDFISMAFDNKGKKQITNQTETMTVNLKPNTYAEVMKYGLRMRQKLDLAPGKYLLKFGVRDTHNNLIGTTSAPVEVPPQS